MLVLLALTEVVILLTKVYGCADWWGAVWDVVEFGAYTVLCWSGVRTAGCERTFAYPQSVSVCCVMVQALFGCVGVWGEGGVRDLGLPVIVRRSICRWSDQPK